MIGWVVFVVCKGEGGGGDLILIDGAIVVPIERRKDVVQEVRHNDLVAGDKIVADKAAHEVEVIIFSGPVSFDWWPRAAQFLNGHIGD